VSSPSSPLHVEPNRSQNRARELRFTLLRRAAAASRHRPAARRLNSAACRPQATTAVRCRSTAQIKSEP
jgi:hypothetical protein